MTDENSTPSITEAAHERGGDGQVLAVTETVEIHGREYEVEVRPATTGERNEWVQRLESEGEEISDEATYELIKEFCALSPDDFGAEDWSDVRPAVTDSIAEVILARLFDAEDVDEFSQALQEVAADATEGNPD